MGIKSNFSRYLNTEYSHVFKHGEFNHTELTSLAVDIPLYLCKYKATYGINWKIGFEGFFKFFRNKNVHLICVFDGESPEEKNSELENRRKNRQRIKTQLEDLEFAYAEYISSGKILPIIENNISKYSSLLNPNILDIQHVVQKIAKLKKHLFNITEEDYDWVETTIVSYGFEICRSSGEGEKLCAELCIAGKVKGVLSDDSDLYAYRCPTIVTKFNVSQNYCTTLYLPDLIKALQMTPDQFLDFAIMCGSDFNRNIPNIAVKRAHQIIKQYGSIDNFARATKVDVSCLNHVRVRELFKITFQNSDVSPTGGSEV